MKLTKILGVKSIKLRGPPDVKKVFADVRLDTCARSVFLKKGGVCNIKESLYLYGRKLFEKVLNIPNMIHVEWKDSEFLNLIGKHGGYELTRWLWLCVGRNRQDE